MAIIEVEHVTKEFQLGQLQGLKQGLRRGLARATGRRHHDTTAFKALDDVHFSVEAGEVLGLIGTNGAGKSTLLKLLAGISKPTAGRVSVRGRVAPLIEVGAGLIGDLTGRENIYLNGCILGMSRKEIARKFDEIVSFAELQQFIDTPIKRYSSGMQVRLGFSIATAVEAEILIIDEVLAVGDLAFQRKCFDRMENIIRDDGRTVLLVSHDARQIERVTHRVLLLDHGRIVGDGNPVDVCNQYFDRSNERIVENASAERQKRSRVHSSGEVELHDLIILNSKGEEVDAINSGEPLRIRFRLNFKQAMDNPEVVVGTHRTDFLYLTATSTAELNQSLQITPGIQQFECTIESFPLVMGTYCIRIAVFDKNRRTVYAGEMLALFSIRPCPDEAKRPPSRTLNISSSWKLPSRSTQDARSHVTTPNAATSGVFK